jgi:hypothetical protein
MSHDVRLPATAIGRRVAYRDDQQTVVDRPLLLSPISVVVSHPRLGDRTLDLDSAPPLTSGTTHASCISPLVRPSQHLRQIEQQCFAWPHNDEHHSFVAKAPPQLSSLSCRYPPGTAQQCHRRLALTPHGFDAGDAKCPSKLARNHQHRCLVADRDSLSGF